jgi:hypothetical protein
MKFNLKKLKRKLIKEKEFWLTGEIFSNKLNNKLKTTELTDGISHAEPSMKESHT